jgi:hypothetical protein
MITKFGCRAILRRASGDRDCVACEITRSPSPREGQLRNPVQRRILVVADGLDPVPNAEKDHLVWLDPDSGAEVENLRLIAPVGRLAPGGVVVFWDLQVRA